MTRQEILNYLYGLSTAKLKKLVNYAELSILPEQDILVNVTMSDMVNKAMQLADVHFPDWTDRSDNDFGKFLVELFALFSEKDFYYLNMFDREGRLPTMQIYHHAYMRALELGYTPQLFETAKAVFTINFGAAVQLPQDIAPPVVPFYFDIGSFEIKTRGLTFTNSERFELGTLNAHERAVNFACGKLKQETYEYLGRPIRIQGTNIDASTLKVVSKTNAGVSTFRAWSRTVQFGGANNTDLLFFVMPEDLALTISFGDGMFGVSPNYGEFFTISYLESFEVCQNLPYSATPCEVVKMPNGSKVQNREVFSIVQQSSIISTKLRESIESIKVKTPLIFSTKGRIINVRDCESLLLSFSDVVKSKAMFWDGVIYFYVIPKFSGNLNFEPFLNGLKTRLDGKQLLGYSIVPRNTTLIEIRPLELTLFVLRGFNLSDIAFETYQKTSEFFDPYSLAQYGKSFVFSDLAYHLISSITGLQNVVFNVVKGLEVSNPVNFPENKVALSPSEITKNFDYATYTIQDFTDTTFNGIKFFCGTTILNVKYQS